MKLLQNKSTIPDRKSLDERLAPHTGTIIIGLLVFVIGGLVLFLEYKFGLRVSAFAVVEYLALSAVAGISTGNYLKTIEQLKTANQNVNDGELNLTLFAIINVLCFVLAASFLLMPEMHILFILLIYFFFSLADIRIVRKLLANDTLLSLNSLPANEVRAGKREHYLCTVFGGIWLKEENGPSVAGFLLVLFAILLFMVIHLVFNMPSHNKADTYHDQLKAFAGGAATFHLALSVLKYWSMIYKQDVVEVVLRNIESEIPAKDEQHLNALQMSDSLKDFFLDSCAWWKPKLVKAVKHAVVIVLVTIVLQWWAH